MKTNLLGNLGVIALNILILVVLTESVTRLLHPFTTVEYRVDPEVGQTLIPNQRSRWVNEDYDQVVTTNSAGFHDHDHQIEKPSNVYRIVVLGDSFIEALSASIESGFTQQLEGLLQPEVAGQRVEVINMAVGGMGPAQHLRMLEMKAMTYRPDLVIMSVFPDNDFWDSYEPLSGSPSKVFYRFRSDGSLEYIPPQITWINSKASPWLRRSAFLSLLRSGIHSTIIESALGRWGALQAPGLRLDSSLVQSEWGVFLATHPDPWPDAYRITLESIKYAHRLAIKGGSQFAVMLIASVAMVEDRWKEALEPYQSAGDFHWDFEYPFTQITELGAQERFSVVSLTEPFRDDFRVKRKSHSWPHDGHWSPAGNQLAAHIVMRHLVTHREAYSLPH